jgi:hypothetical protein
MDEDFFTLLKYGIAIGFILGLYCIILFVFGNNIARWIMSF